MNWKLILSLVFLSTFAVAVSNKVVDVDVLKSPDHTKVWTLPSATDTIAGIADTQVFTNKSISGSTNTLTNIPLSTAMTGLLPMANGGCNKLMTAVNGGLFWSDADSCEILAAGSSGQILRSGGAATPAWSTATYPATAGTSGKVLISDGTNIVASTPTFPNASATSGKFIRSDGTNWIASTPTLPTSAGTAGKVLTSDGTNYIESTPTFPNASATSGKFIRSDGTNWIASTPTVPTAAGGAGTFLRSDGTNYLTSGLTIPDSATSGGIPYFSSTSAISSSGLLTASQLVLGGGAGATPTTLAAGSQYQSLTMGASNPGYSAVNLAQSAAVTGALAIGNGGSGQTTKAAAFDALSPMTTGGDIIYGGASGTGTRLANGSAGQVLTSSGTTVAPTWTTVLTNPMDTAGQMIYGGASGVPTKVAVGTAGMPIVSAGATVAFAFPVVTAVKTSNYNVAATDDLVLVDGTSAFQATLPTAVGYSGKIFRIKRVDQALANAVTIGTTSSQTIDGSTTRKLMTQYEQYTVQSDGSNWQVISHTYPQGWTSFTPTGSWSTNCTFTGKWRRVGDSMQVLSHIAIATGAPTAANLTINLPTGVTINTGSLTDTTANGVLPHSTGSSVSGSGTYGLPLIITYSSTTAVLVRTPQQRSTDDIQLDTVTNLLPATYGNTDMIEINYQVPITNWEP